MKIEMILIGLSVGGTLSCLFEIARLNDRYVTWALYLSMVLRTVGIIAVCIMALIVAAKIGVSP